MNKDTFCFLPFSHISIKTTGTIVQCCNGQKLLQNEKHMNIKDINIIDAFYSDHMNRIRSDLLNGIKAPECKKCWEIEKRGAISKRSREIKKYELNSKYHNDILESIESGNIVLKNIEVRFGNKCNLKCITCNSYNSSQIASEISVNHLMIDNDLLLKEIIRISPNIKRLSFVGGEPLLHEEMYKLLDYLIDNGYSKNISLYYTTNLTVAKEDFFKKIKHFNYTVISVSIDAIGKRNNYIRFGSKFESIERNLSIFKSMIPRDCLIISTVFYNLNVFCFHNIEEFAKKHDLNLLAIKLFHPSFLKPHIIPESIKQTIIKQSENSTNNFAISYTPEIMKPYTEEEKNQFIEYIKRKDELRGTNILDYCPEFEEWFS